MIICITSTDYCFISFPEFLEDEPVTEPPVPTYDPTKKGTDPPVPTYDPTKKTAESSIPDSSTSSKIYYIPSPDPYIDKFNNTEWQAFNAIQWDQR